MKNKRISGRYYILILAVIVLLSAVYQLYRDENLELSEGTLEVHMIDIGQGDCILIRGKKNNILIDAGPETQESTLQYYFSSYGILDFEYVVFTHPHDDHIGGGDMVVNYYKIKNIIMPDAVTTTSSYKRLLEAIDNKDCDIIVPTVGSVFESGDIKMTILSPMMGKDYSDLNGYSIVLRLDYGNKSFMFAGDSIIENEKDMIGKFPPSQLDCDVLKVAHHGSTSSSSEEFLALVSPKIALISCGASNSYGHPHAEVLNRIESYTDEIYRTDIDKTVVIATDGKSVWYKNKT